MDPKNFRKIQKDDLIDLYFITDKSSRDSLSLLKYDSIKNESYLAIINNEIVGYIIVEKMITSYFIHYLYVNSNYRNKGIASSLLNIIKQSNLPILLYHNKELTSFYKSNNFVIGENLVTSQYIPL